MQWLQFLAVVAVTYAVAAAAGASARFKETIRRAPPARTLDNPQFSRCR